MLSEVVLELLKKYEKVSVIARSSSGFENLKALALHNAGKINSLKFDYCNYTALRDSINQAVMEHGSISLAVSWIHSTAPLAPVVAAKTLNDFEEHCDFFELLGSTYSDPLVNSSGISPGFGAFSNISYHKIVLGFITEMNNSRWLSNNEIARGVIDALENNLDETIIGVVKPWDKRP